MLGAEIQAGLNKQEAVGKGEGNDCDPSSSTGSQKRKIVGSEDNKTSDEQQEQATDGPAEPTSKKMRIEASQPWHFRERKTDRRE